MVIYHLLLGGFLRTRVAVRRMDRSISVELELKETMESCTILARTFLEGGNATVLRVFTSSHFNIQYLSFRISIMNLAVIIGSFFSGVRS